MWWKSYREAVRKYPAGLSSEKKVERFLTEEGRRGVADITQNQALNALFFFHGAVLGTPLGGVDALRVTRAATVRVALSPGQTAALLGALEEVGGFPARLVARLIYRASKKSVGPSWRRAF